MSVAMTATGYRFVATVVCVANVVVAAPAAVVLSSSETVSLSWLATTRSSLPSALRSTATMACGFVPVAKVCCAANVGVCACAADAQQTPSRAISLAGARSVVIGVQVVVRLRNSTGISRKNLRKMRRATIAEARPYCDEPPSR